MRILAAIALSFFLSTPATAAPRVSATESVQRAGEQQIRRLLEPLIEKYCREECKLLSVAVTVDVATPDEVAPGFDDVVSSQTELAPSSARIKMLIDDKVGPVSRNNLMGLMQQFLDTLDFPVKVDTQLAHFPQPLGTEGRVAELRERLIKQFRGTIEELFTQFCPEQCLLADFNLATEVVNAEEAQYGTTGEFLQDGGTAIRVKDISATLLVDDTLTPEERANVLEMAKLKTNAFKRVSLTAKSLHFPRPSRMGRDAYLAGNGVANGRNPASLNGGNNSEKNERSEKSDARFNSDSKSLSNETRALNSNSQNTSLNNTKATDTNSSTSNNQENNKREEHFSRFEKIERVESGDAVQAELQKFKVYGLVFACAIISLLVFLSVAGFRGRSTPAGESSIQRVIQTIAGDPEQGGPSAIDSAPTGDGDMRARVGQRFEIERLLEELMAVFAQHPRVAKHVFSRVLTEEGIETTAQYIQIFGESIVVDMLRDPSLQSDLSELMEFYAKNPQDITDNDKLDLLKRLHNRTVAGKLVVMGNRSSNLFDFLAEMDGTQIMELVRNESMTVKSIVLTQVDPNKRTALYTHLDEDSRMKLLTELSRIDYLPRDYIFNVANALKRKRRDNPKLNTEALPGSEVLVNLLERTGPQIQKAVVKNLELTNPESARTVKSKLVSIDTLRFLRDGQLLEVILSLRHDELVQFLKGASAEIRQSVFVKSPKELVLELEEELAAAAVVSREQYLGLERKVLNRMKMMSGEGLINLIETNERMLGDAADGAMNGNMNPGAEAIAMVAGMGGDGKTQVAPIKKVAGW